MSFFKSASVLAISAILMTGVSVDAAQALTLKQAAQPKETPPAGYRGDVFVDSRGCVYVRASVGTKVNWVPRLSRDRKSVVCGLTPTASGSQVAAAPPKPIAPPKPAPLEVAAAPAAKPAAKPNLALSAPSGTGRELNAAARPSSAAMSAPQAGQPLTTAKPARNTGFNLTNLPKPSGPPAPTVFRSTPQAPKATAQTTARRPMATVAGSTQTGFNLRTPSGAPAPTVFSSTQPAAAAAAPQQGAVQVVRSRQSTQPRGVGFSDQAPNHVITQGNRPAYSNQGVGFGLQTPSYVPRTQGQTSYDTSSVRTLNVTCPAGGQTARVRVGGNTVAVKCDPASRSPSVYNVRHEGGAMTRLVANPAPGPVAVAQTSVPAPRYGSARVRIGGTAPNTSHTGFGYGPTTTSTVASVASVSLAPRGVQSNVASRSAHTPEVRRPRGPFSNPASDFVQKPRTQRSLYEVENTFGNGFGLAPIAGAGRVVVNAPTAPAGYRQAWEDDRLNPRRGPQTIRGVEQTQVIWSNTVPRTQIAAPVVAAKTSTVVVSSKNAVRRSAPKAAPVAAPAATASANRYLQVGTFRDPANAQRTAARLQGLGLAGRVAKTRSGMNVVVAGPYSDPAQLRNALAIARRGGFSDAILRR